MMDIKAAFSKRNILKNLSKRKGNSVNSLSNCLRSSVRERRRDFLLPEVNQNQ